MVLSELPHWVENASILVESEQLVGHGNCVYMRMFAIVEIRIWSPDFVQHFDAKRQTLDGSLEAQSLVSPILPEITVHGVVHIEFWNGSHASDKYIGSNNRR